MDEDEARDRIAEWRELAQTATNQGTAAAFEMCADEFEEFLDNAE